MSSLINIQWLMFDRDLDYNLNFGLTRIKRLEL